MNLDDKSSCLAPFRRCSQSVQAVRLQTAESTHRNGFSIAMLCILLQVIRLLANELLLFSQLRPKGFQFLAFRGSFL